MAGRHLLACHLRTKAVLSRPAWGSWERWLSGRHGFFCAPTSEVLRLRKLYEPRVRPVDVPLHIAEAAESNHQRQLARLPNIDTNLCRPVARRQFRGFDLLLFAVDQDLEPHAPALAGLFIQTHRRLEPFIVCVERVGHLALTMHAQALVIDAAAQAEVAA